MRQTTQDILPTSNARAMVVAPLSRWSNFGWRLPKLDKIDFIEYAGLDADSLEVDAPDTIFSNLYEANFDVIDIATKLVKHGFRGQYFAISKGAVDIDLVRSEVKSAAPGLDFDILNLAPAPMPRAANQAF